MKQSFIFILIIAIAAFLFAGCVSTKTSQVTRYDTLDSRKRVAVLDIANKTKYGARELSDSASEILTSELSRSGNFTLIERDQLDKILEELELQLSDITDATQSAKVGQILNCEYLLSGSISNFGVKTEGRDLLIAQQKVQTVVVEVDIKVIKVETSEIVYSAYGMGTAEKVVDNVLGMGGKAGYDESLAAMGLRACMSQVVTDLIRYFKGNP
ncbi:MAG: hypothetical protein JW969_14395 [Spirochaetales bacterium]|nr:hypothetical protein [Spirochaetales bacterium]